MILSWLIALSGLSKDNKRENEKMELARQARRKALYAKPCIKNNKQGVECKCDECKGVKYD